MGTFGQTIRLYLHIVKRYWIIECLMLTLVIVAVVSADIVAPYLVSRILNNLTQVASGHAQIAATEELFFWFAVISLLGMLAWRTVGFTVARFQARIARDIERMVFENLTLHSYGFFANRFGGALVTQTNRFVRGYEMLEDLMLFEVLPLLTRLVIVLVILTLAIPSIGIALLVWTTFFIATVLWMTVKKQPYTRRASATDTHNTARIADVITNILNVKTFGRRKEEVASYRKLNERRRLTRQKSWTIDEFVGTYQHLLNVAFIVVSLWLSIRAVQHGTASIADVLLAQFYIARTSGDLQNLQGITRRIGLAFSDATEMTKILTLEPEIKDPVKPQKLYVAQGGIRFEQVTFAYDGNRPVFRDFDLEIAPGEQVGLVGHSGSGKTTLVKVLLRFLDIQKGQITIDYQDIALAAQDDLRSQIAYVAQEPVLFHRTLAENIRYSRPKASDTELRRVAKLAHAAEFIEALPEGYDTLVGERGIKLSGGERQRVAIARAMLADAPILVLDEATSSLDSESETLITDALKVLMKDRTTLVIAHRLSTIRNLDRIVVMDHGRIRETGSHQELIASDDAYAGLWRHQTGGFLIE